MKCSACECTESKVLESRVTEAGSAIRRRRECFGCRRRFTTYERAQEMPLVVIKKNGTRESFDRGKVQIGMVKACEKRPIGLERIEQAVEQIETTLRNEEPSSEVSSSRVGQKVMEHLLRMDDVAYIRFASVHKEFDDAKKFAEVLAALSGGGASPPRSTRGGGGDRGKQQANGTSLAALTGGRRNTRKSSPTQQPKKK
ncbi:MAG: transcriptional regulator NrdR [Armatimonadetes bacterium CG2_30_59_28]|nr:transcriptional repressor NrdR [Armatimonadota bacterium]OIO89350.1 MAG: transcriptional regulator NrdR [Armatimonadetes bacterium CG2_30_59_28]PIU66503.1 MAG: transcriptional regulator NrdR [Armatimonadetes bacterium CG07_land_8_20_14_0_80_59_28]PIX46092.1 MAG: transcriptional regulator NrdR [Armatimonadetes bacterium CG_4_8_14_3_um_filter_58_9]PIY38381.1 MAG: transcriptional regulator NrdR [Armatimonadetes bacterium CG_4_10_14_3_um_filter_59_10]PJB66628.1 MAG: transcriptional regulator Nr